jgi:hypothetical protein
MDMNCLRLDFTVDNPTAFVDEHVEWVAPNQVVIATVDGVVRIRAATSERLHRFLHILGRSQPGPVDVNVAPPVDPALLPERYLGAADRTYTLGWATPASRWVPDLVPDLNPHVTRPVVVTDALDYIVAATIITQTTATFAADLRAHPSGARAHRLFERLWDAEDLVNLAEIDVTLVDAMNFVHRYYMDVIDEWCDEHGTSDLYEDNYAGSEAWTGE